MTIPTYVIGPPDPNPMFYLGRNYQGARGRIYPYPVYDKITDDREPRTYKAVWLENEYVKICVLPELGGRIFIGQDKTNGYDFFYRQHVIKPAIVGMLGAWISGGVEWNVPHHHRASSFLPVQYRTETGADGSATVWVGEMELRHRMRWAVGLTLRPGKAYLEANVRVVNRTPFAQSMLYFANVAVHTNMDYQIIFPPSTQFVTQHAKREFARWPVATEVYGGVDFTKGVDVSQWKNHPSPISMFAWNYQDDFLAGYDHGRNAGTLHIADHHTVPGKKFWTWGNGPFGKMWDQILSDEDGPYVELMVGAYSDNQPDYSWIEPFETRSFRHVWYPFQQIGGVKNANADAAVNLEVTNHSAKLGFHATSARPDAVVRLTAGTRVLFEQHVAIDPGKPFLHEVTLPENVRETELRASLEAGGKELIAYQPVKLERQPMPPAVQPPPAPKDVPTNEDLYTIGLRATQFHSPTVDPYPYYEEALRRDPGDARVNAAVGELYLKRAMYAEAEKHLRAAIERLSRNYTTPRNGEPYYYLGAALKAQDKLDAAYDAFYHATWDNAFQSASFFSLAEIACRRRDFPAALSLLDRSLSANAQNTRALNLKSAVLRAMGKPADAAKAAESAAAIDPLDLHTAAEQYLLGKNSRDGDKLLASLIQSLSANAGSGLEVGVEYGNAGLWDDAIEILSLLSDAPAQPALPTAIASPERSRVTPLAFYFLGYFAERAGRRNRADYYYKSAAKLVPDYTFPFQLEAIDALRAAMRANPQDARAPYYLGTLLFDIQPEVAMKEWHKAVQLDPSFAPAYRNMAVGYSQQPDGTAKAIEALETAVRLNPDAPTYYVELDSQYEAAAVPIEKRLALFDAHHAIVVNRDDALAREIHLRIQAGQYDRAIEQLTHRHFHTAEGGARFNPHDSWMDAHILRGRERLNEKKVEQAISDFEAALQWPVNLEDAPAYRGGRAPEALYWLGVAREAAGDREHATEAWKQAAEQLLGSEESAEPTVDSGAEVLFYQALSLEKLGEKDRAAAILRELRQAARTALAQPAPPDYFAKFGERQSRRVRVAQAHFIAGLADVGLGNTDSAKKEFAQAVELNPYHLSARAQLASLK